MILAFQEGPNRVCEIRFVVDVENTDRFVGWFHGVSTYDKFRG